MAAKQKIIIIGAGGHGREVADFVLRGDSTEPYDLVGFLDDDSELSGKKIGGITGRGSVSAMNDFSPAEYKFVCALGSPIWMRRITRSAEQFGFSLASVICKDAVISSSAEIEPGSLIFPGVVINRDVRIRKGVTLNVGASVSHDTVVEQFSNINPGARLAGNVTIGEGTFIGMNASVIQGVFVGKWSIVGAGAVVTRDLPPNITAVGVPAEIIKEREEGWHDPKH